MKMILNNRYFGKSLLLVSACSLWILGACTGDFMETNTDPNAVTEEELGYDNLGTGSMITQMQYQMYPCITKDQNIDVNNYQKMFSLAGDIFSGHQELPTCLIVTEETIRRMICIPTGVRRLILWLIRII